MALLQRFGREAEIFTTGIAAGSTDAATLRHGPRALHALERKRELQPAAGDDAVVELKNLAALAHLTACYGKALRYTLELIDQPECASSADCFCTAVGSAVNRLRSTNGSAALDFFDARSAGVCPYDTAWQMPSPPGQYDPRLTARPFWPPADFGAAHFLEEHMGTILPELQAYTRQGTAAHGAAAGRAPRWRTDTDTPYELIEAGAWRQLSLYESNTGWDETICDALPVTCGLIKEFHMTEVGRRELGTKVKIFELGPWSSLTPHFGITNTRLFLHVAISAPRRSVDGGGGGAYLRVGAAPPLRWERAGQMVVFDDSFEHEVWNDGPDPRYVFGLELRHPETPAEGWYQGGSGWAAGR